MLIKCLMFIVSELRCTFMTTNLPFYQITDRFIKQRYWFLPSRNQEVRYKCLTVPPGVSRMKTNPKSEPMPQITFKYT